MNHSQGLASAKAAAQVRNIAVVAVVYPAGACRFCMPALLQLLVLGSQRLPEWMDTVWLWHQAGYG
jgi:hypothetical protein